MEKKITYAKAMVELETILIKIENDELDLEQLTDKLKRANELIRLCREKLHTTEKEVENILKEMGEGEAGEK
ncbi:MAG: exodeoxyribonuclease VII small subunit [Bacteroidetes bacterium RIFCSPLOWO2_02_FULL_36_8]|nr:MAG: exodeoxyribonuclease VII small subunit [Bacteroidetes bacterium RIFCSPLOWO2_02_FULL_36_8]OFY70359.1 MAG: exodeoxyribonuclease VII small subunit [Bacteroidetes bacterium RIFCSPLOWO2_12_FULL_37_12]